MNNLKYAKRGIATVAAFGLLNAALFNTTVVNAWYHCGTPQAESDCPEKQTPVPTKVPTKAPTKAPTAKPTAVPPTPLPTAIIPTQAPPYLAPTEIPQPPRGATATPYGTPVAPNTPQATATTQPPQSSATVVIPTPIRQQPQPVIDTPQVVPTASLPPAIQATPQPQPSGPVPAAQSPPQGGGISSAPNWTPPNGRPFGILWPVDSATTTPTPTVTPTVVATVSIPFAPEQTPHEDTSNVQGPRGVFR